MKLKYMVSTGLHATTGLNIVVERSVVSNTSNNSSELDTV